jgi:hypothetical protein
MRAKVQVLWIPKKYFLVSGSADPDPGCRLITGQAGSGSYLDIFWGIRKNVLSNSSKSLNIYRR